MKQINIPSRVIHDKEEGLRQVIQHDGVELQVVGKLVSEGEQMPLYLEITVDSKHLLSAKPYEKYHISFQGKTSSHALVIEHFGRTDTNFEPTYFLLNEIAFTIDDIPVSSTSLDPAPKISAARYAIYGYLLFELFRIGYLLFSDVRNGKLALLGIYVAVLLLTVYSAMLFKKNALRSLMITFCIILCELMDYVMLFILGISVTTSIADFNGLGIQPNYIVGLTLCWLYVIGRGVITLSKLQKYSNKKTDKPRYGDS